MTDNIGKLIDIEQHNGNRFQNALADLAIKNNCKVIVESGCGVSSVFFLHKMKHSLDAHDAKLFSIDPAKWYPNDIVSDQHELILGKSIDEMWKLYLRTGPWDMFLHDGNHDIKCQTYEFEFAYKCLKVGGILACDDYTWGGHNAWQDFLKRNNLTATKLGDIEYIIKQGTEVKVENAEDFHYSILSFAIETETKWLAAGNKNSEFFKD